MMTLIPAPNGEAGLTGAPSHCTLRLRVCLFPVLAPSSGAGWLPHGTSAGEHISFCTEAVAGHLQKACGEPVLCARVGLPHPPVPGPGRAWLCVSTGIWAGSPSHPIGQGTPPGPTTDPPSGIGLEAANLPEHCLHAWAGMQGWA